MDENPVLNVVYTLLGITVLVTFCYYVVIRPLKNFLVDKGSRKYWLIVLLGSAWIFGGIWLIDWLSRQFEHGRTAGTAIYFLVIAAIVISIFLYEARGRTARK